jgi:hypothetical protein
MRLIPGTSVIRPLAPVVGKEAMVESRESRDGGSETQR